MKQLFVTVILSLSMFTFGQTTEKLKIFYDCNTYGCNETYVKQNLPQVEFVRDRNYAEVHILIVSEANGSGGSTYQLEFIGQHKFKNLQHKLHFSTGSDTTQEQLREKLLKYLKLGLLNFWIEKGLADKISLEIKTSNQKKEEKDKWHNWIFKIGGNGWFNGDSNSTNANYNAYLSAKQVKEMNKFSFSLRYNYQKNTYNYNESEIISEREFFNVNLSHIWGLDQHWSYGVFTRFDRSRYSNYKYAGELYGGLEYNLFPYKESAKKSLTLTTKIGGLYNNYFEKTIYNKSEELLWRAKFFLNGNLVKKWGSLYAGFDYASYLHDLKLNSMGFYAGADLRIVKGLSFNANAYYGIQHDQINVAAGNLSLEETLLAQKELQSGYSYYFRIGLSYSFGSIYNSIVNPRFDSSEEQGRTCICF